jgi:hypothetical protein
MPCLQHHTGTRNVRQKPVVTHITSTGTRTPISLSTRAGLALSQVAKSVTGFESGLLGLVR